MPRRKTTSRAQSFTPGPWRLNDPADSRTSEKDHHCIAAGSGYFDPNGRQKGFSVADFMSEPDARLIAIAPDLYTETVTNIAAMRQAAEVLHSCRQISAAKRLTDRAEASEAVLKMAQGGE